MYQQFVSINSVCQKDHQLYEGNELYSKTKAAEIKLNQHIEETNNSIASYDEKISFYLNHINQFVENGYEVHQHRVYLENWYKDKTYRKDVKIFFKKDYSSRPFLFFTMNKISNLILQPNEESGENLSAQNITNFLYITTNLKQLMTSYFVITVELNVNESIDPELFSEGLIKSIPYIEIQYLVVNNIK